MLPAGHKLDKLEQGIGGLGAGIQHFSLTFSKSKGAKRAYSGWPNFKNESAVLCVSDNSE